jgi:hypothetical protein
MVYSSSHTKYKPIKTRRCTNHLPLETWKRQPSSQVFTTPYTFRYVRTSCKIVFMYEITKSNVTLDFKISNYVKIYFWKDSNIWPNHTLFTLCKRGKKSTLNAKYFIKQETFSHFSVLLLRKTGGSFLLDHVSSVYK